MGKKLTTMRFTEQDLQAIETIKQLYACNSDIAAVRLALQIVARQEISPGAQARDKERHSHPHG